MATQKELKAAYTEELKKAWQDEYMITHCSRATAYIIEHEGALYGIEKPKIETSFCFGYGMNGTYNDEEECDADIRAEHAQSSAEYFKARNLEYLDRQIARLRDILKDMGLNWATGNHPRYMIETGAHYYGQTEDCRLRYYSIIDTYGGGTSQGKICNDTELIQKLIAGYEEVRKDFTKRLNTYLKRYGLSKVNSWSYLRD